MTLQIGDYKIPDDCRATVAGGVVYVYQRKPKGRKKSGRKHCRDCAHSVQGFAVASSCRKSRVCLLRPKRLITTYTARKLYYAVDEYDEICENFKEKE